MNSTQLSPSVLAETASAILNQNKGMETGFPALDKRINGLQKGAFYVVGGRPGMGATTLALSIMQHVAVNSGKKVLYISLDLPFQRVVARMIKICSGIDLERTRAAVLDATQQNLLSDTIERVGSAPITITASLGATIEEVAEMLYEQDSNERVELVIIDYLQCMCSQIEWPSRQREIKSICYQLKELARELDISLIALSSISRSVEQRPDHRPLLSDLSGSESIEQEADAVLLLYRDAYYYPGKAGSEMTEIIVGKNTFGVTGIEQVNFVENRTCYIMN